MRCQAKMKRAAFLSVLILLASATGTVFAGGPADGGSARECLQLQSRTAVPGTFGCMKFVYLRNSCDLHTVAQVLITQHLFSGTLRQAVPVVVPAGGEQSLGCAWWSGATASAQHELLDAQFFVPLRYEPRDHHHGPNRH